MSVRGKAITHSASRLVKTEISKEHKFASASPGNKCRSKEECISMSNSSRKKPSHYSNPILEEKLGASANINSSDTSCCQNLENLAFLESKNRTEDPFSVFTTHELQDKASPSFSGFKSGAHVTNSFPCSITSGKIAFGDSPVFSDVRPWPTCPKFSSKPQFKGPRNVASFHCKTSSPGFSVQESVSKDEEMKVKQQKDSHGSFELREEIFMGNNGWTSEKKAVEGASTSDSHTQDCKGEKDPNVMMTQSLETTHSIGHVEEEVSSSLKKTDKHESKVDNTKYVSIYVSLGLESIISSYLYSLYELILRRLSFSAGTIVMMEFLLNVTLEMKVRKLGPFNFTVNFLIYCSEIGNQFAFSCALDVKCYISFSVQ